MNRLHLKPVPKSASIIQIVHSTQQDIDSRWAKIEQQMPKKPVPIKRRKK